jgi:hypothetical protein
MKNRTLAIALCVVFGIQSLFFRFDISDVLYLPELATHYHAHRIESPETTFLEFLQLHYGTNSRHLKQDPIHHQKLPFSKRTHGHSTMPFLFLTIIISEIPTSFMLIRSIGDVYYGQNQSAKAVGSIWQPPRA